MTFGKHLRKGLLLSAAATFALSLSAAAQGNKIKAISDPPPPQRPAPKQVFPLRDAITSDKPEAMPLFKGKLEDFYKQNLAYIPKAKKSTRAREAEVGFVIEATGRVTEVRLTKSSGDKLLDMEAVRVIGLMKDSAYWKPGMHRGAPVAVYYTLPVKFSKGPVKKAVRR
jgi:TonB family protein